MVDYRLSSLEGTEIFSAADTDERTPELKHALGAYVNAVVMTFGAPEWPHEIEEAVSVEMSYFTRPQLQAMLGRAG
jgi:hypothetical protein